MAAIQIFIGSMKRHCQAVIASRGSHTSYWQLLLLVTELFGTFSWLGVTFWNLHFWGSGGNLNFWGSTSLTTEWVLPIVHIWWMIWNSRNKHVLEYMPFYFLCDTHKKHNTTLNSGPGKCWVVYDVRSNRTELSKPQYLLARVVLVQVHG